MQTTVQYITYFRFMGDIMFSIGLMATMEQNQTRRYVLSSSTNGGTCGEVCCLR